MNVFLMIAWNYEPPERLVTLILVLYYYLPVMFCRKLNGTEVAVPAVPELEDNNWFFSYALYIGGGIHLLMSLVMAISYFIINRSNFVMPAVFNRM